MKNTKIKHHLIKQVFFLGRVVAVRLGSETIFSKSLGNSKMTDPIKGYFNDHYRRLIKINNYPNKYQAINSIIESMF